MTYTKLVIFAIAGAIALAAIDPDTQVNNSLFSLKAKRDGSETFGENVKVNQIGISLSLYLMDDLEKLADIDEIVAHCKSIAYDNEVKTFFDLGGGIEELSKMEQAELILNIGRVLRDTKQVYTIQFNFLAWPEDTLEYRGLRVVKNEGGLYVTNQGTWREREQWVFDTEEAFHTWADGFIAATIDRM